jgi:two-component system, chemotaxis family, chemotaxis protein CheY
MNKGLRNRSRAPGRVDRAAEKPPICGEPETETPSGSAEPQRTSTIQTARAASGSMPRSYASGRWSILKAASKLLGRFQQALSESCASQEALEKLASTASVDLIITDLNMPVMDGITFIQNVRKQPALMRKPILMLTTEGLASKKEQGKAAGATGWIVKPFDPEKLLTTIAKVLP